jgi:cation diffusion facilitator family transporter
MPRDRRPGEHEHHFGQADPAAGEARTRVVVALTATMMVAEVVAGLAFGSMALLADGLHMGSHTVALGIALFAYVYARRRAHDGRFSFGPGKVNALGGFTGAVLLVGFAVGMAWESVDRFLHPVPIVFDRAILVAALGLAVNVASAWILGVGHHDHGHAHHHHDHNLRSAYLHVLADALTSVTALVALLAGKHLGWTWMDPAMGIAGAVLVVLWSRGLLRQTTRVLLDHQAPADLVEAVRDALEQDGLATVTDLHLWSIGPGRYAAAIALVSSDDRPPAAWKALLPASVPLVHATLEVHPP